MFWHLDDDIPKEMRLAVGFKGSRGVRREIVERGKGTEPLSAVSSSATTST